jgi:carboxymethylenebutenolidase
MSDSSSQLLRPNHSVIPGHLAEASGGKGLAVLVLHEWWGLNSQMKGVADRFAAEGITAFALDLYAGRVAASEEEASSLMQGLDRAAAVALIREATHTLAGRGYSKVVVLGFCMGGAVALSAGSRIPELSAVISFYGIPQKSQADLGNIRVPVLGQFAEHDDWCTPERVSALEAALKQAGAPVTLWRYDAQHAFFNEARPEVYSSKDAALAWSRTLEFLRAL